MKTITIDNKHYQECDLVMLPTEFKRENYIPLFKLNSSDILSKFRGFAHSVSEFFHLYVLSNETPKENDWCINANNRVVRALKDDRDFEPLRKIIATTDSYLTIKVKDRFLTDGITIHKQLYKQIALPQIPQYFIEHFINEYNEGNVINKILVEFTEEIPEGFTFGLHGNDEPVTEFKIKLNQSNEISITIEQEQLFTKEDFINALHKVELKHNKSYSKLWDEIQQHLK